MDRPKLTDADDAPLLPWCVALRAIQAQRAVEGRQQISILTQESQQRNHDPYSLNKQLRAAMRQSKRETAKVDAK